MAYFARPRLKIKTGASQLHQDRHDKSPLMLDDKEKTVILQKQLTCAFIQEPSYVLLWNSGKIKLIFRMNMQVTERTFKEILELN